MRPDVSSRQIAYLLDELCGDLGFCLPPADHARLQAEPPTDVDAFTDAVFAAEGLDPSASVHRQLREQARARVARCFERDGMDAA